MGRAERGVGLPVRQVLHDVEVPVPTGGDDAPVRGDDEALRVAEEGGVAAAAERGVERAVGVEAGDGVLAADVHLAVGRRGDRLRRPSARGGGQAGGEGPVGREGDGGRRARGRVGGGGERGVTAGRGRDGEVVFGVGGGVQLVEVDGRQRPAEGDVPVDRAVGVVGTQVQGVAIPLGRVGEPGEAEGGGVERVAGDGGRPRRPPRPGVRRRVQEGAGAVVVRGAGGEARVGDARDQMVEGGADGDPVARGRLTLHLHARARGQARPRPRHVDARRRGGGGRAHRRDGERALGGVVVGLHLRRGERAAVDGDLVQRAAQAVGRPTRRAHGKAAGGAGIAGEVLAVGEGAVDVELGDRAVVGADDVVPLGPVEVDAGAGEPGPGGVDGERQPAPAGDQLRAPAEGGEDLVRPVGGRGLHPRLQRHVPRRQGRVGHRGDAVGPVAQSRGVVGHRDPAGHALPAGGRIGTVEGGVAAVAAGVGGGGAAGGLAQPPVPQRRVGRHGRRVGRRGEVRRGHVRGGDGVDQHGVVAGVRVHALKADRVRPGGEGDGGGDEPGPIGGGGAERAHDGGVDQDAEVLAAVVAGGALGGGEAERVGAGRKRGRLRDGPVRQADDGRLRPLGHGRSGVVRAAVGRDAGGPGERPRRAGHGRCEGGAGGEGGRFETRLPQRHGHQHALLQRLGHRPGGAGDAVAGSSVRTDGAGAKRPQDGTNRHG